MNPVIRNVARGSIGVAAVLLLALSLLCGYGAAQTVNGSLHGTVVDPTGAVVANAHVEVKSLSHGEIREAMTDSHGFYTIVNLPPAHYSVSVSIAGFTTVTQSDVELLVHQDLEANYTLKMGQVTQTIEVTGATTMIDTTGATLEQVIAAKAIVDLPLNGRQFTQLILLSPGAAPKETGQQTGQIVSVGGGGISPSMNGQQGTQNNFFLDGIMNNAFFTEGWNISPPPDAIQEFSAENHTTDSRFGMSPGSNINLVTKSGTPQFHGNLWEFLRNDAADAANFFDNLTGSPKPPYRQNQFGGTFGGPVMLPWYDGRQRHTYFFGYYEGFRAAQSQTSFGNVPTSQEEGGDFSDLLTTTPILGSNGQPETDALGRPMLQGAIYNPYSTRQVTAGVVDPTTGIIAPNSGLVRDPFPGNKIPSSLITPDAALYLNAFYPSPNYGPGGNNFPNYVAPTPALTTANSFGVGLDHTFANNDTLDGKFYYGQVFLLSPSIMKVGKRRARNDGRTGAATYTHVFSPTFEVSAKYGYIWNWFGRPSDPAGATLLNAINAQDVLPIQDGLALVPQVSLGSRFNGTSQAGNALGPNRTHQINVDLQKVKGAHTLSAGFLFTKTHSFDNGWDANYNFDQFPTSGIDGTGINQPLSGDGLASMLLNTPSELFLFYGNTAADIKSYVEGYYGQDKWQVSKKLSVTAGMRWDFQSPPHYLNNQFAMWDTNCPFPASNQNLTQDQINKIYETCNLIPIAHPVSPTPQFPDPPTWPTPNTRSTIWVPQYNGFQPRLGIAYALTPSTVIRTGFGIFDDHNDFQQISQDARGSWPFGGTTDLPNLNRGIPDTFWTNLPATSTFLNNPVVLVGRAENPKAKIPYTMEYNFGISRQLTPNMALTVDYVGSQGRHQFGAYGYNAPLLSQMGPNAVPNGEPFPFLGSTIQADDTIFNNNYNALQAKLEKRTSKGLNFLVSYTYSRCMDVSEGMWEMWPENTYDMNMDYGPCDYDFPHVLSVSGVYDLPFGRGKAFGGNMNRLADAVVGGWHFSDITQAHSGSPFNVFVPFDSANNGIEQRANYVPGCKLLPPGFKQSWQAWYNPDCFVVPPLYTFGTDAKNSLRGPMILQFDMSLFKDFNLTETKRIEFRADAFNIFNRVNLSPPGGGATGFSADLGGQQGTTVAAPGFMQIFGAAPARIMQIALKVYF